MKQNIFTAQESLCPMKITKLLWILLDSFYRKLNLIIFFLHKTVENALD